MARNRQEVLARRLSLFFEFGFKGDPKAKAAIFDGGLKRLGFEIQHKNWKL